MIKMNITLSIAIIICMALSSCKKKNFDDVVTATVRTGGRTYYVSDPLGNDNNNGASQQTPFKSITKALPYLQPSDTLYIMTGTYGVSSTINFATSGKPGKYITIKALANNTPVLYASGNNYNAVSITGSYIKFDGIELKGDNANLTLTGAMASYNSSIAATPQLSGVYNTNALGINGVTHVEVRNCKIHDFPAAGIGCGTSDYITLDNNTIYNNSWYTIYASSGISVINPVNSDAVTGYKIFITNNKVFNNKTQVPWINTKALSDGNGIICDINAHNVNNDPNSGYNGRTLVENNISVNNGGGGVHAFFANHVDIINNTAYNNGIVVGYPDIDVQSCDDTKIINNIMYARTGGKAQDNYKSTNFTVDYNIYYNGTNATTGTHDKVANPLFINPSTDITLANFQLTSGSPAVNNGSTTIFSPYDILGIARPKGAAPDCGAYESF